MTDLTLGELIEPAGIAFQLVAPDKEALLLALARQAAALAGREVPDIVDVILRREALGSTGFGAGTAIPHGRLPDLARIVVVAARLAVPVDFAALDGLPVDLVILMLAPEGEGADHLKALARVSRLLRDASACRMLRGASTADAFFALLAGPRRSVAA